MLVREASPDMTATIGNGHQFAGVAIRVSHQRVGLFTVNATGQLDRANTLRMQLVVGQGQQATGAIVQPYGSHDLIVSFSLNLDPVTVAILETPQLERFAIRIGTSAAEIAIHPVDRLDHIVATFGADQVNAFRHAEMAFTRRHGREHDIAPLLVPVRDRRHFAVFTCKPQLDADRHAPPRPEQAVGTIVETAIETLPDDRQRPGRTKSVSSVPSSTLLPVMTSTGCPPMAAPGYPARFERTRREIHRKTWHLAFQEVAPAHLPAAARRERDPKRGPSHPSRVADFTSRTRCVPPPMKTLSEPSAIVPSQVVLSPTRAAG